jgi:hypothetical protein
MPDNFGGNPTKMATVGGDRTNSLMPLKVIAVFKWLVFNRNIFLTIIIEQTIRYANEIRKIAV